MRKAAHRTVTGVVVVVVEITGRMWRNPHDEIWERERNWAVDVVGIGNPKRVACSMRGEAGQLTTRWVKGRGQIPKGSLGGGSLVAKRSILTGDHHGLIWAAGEKHGSAILG